MQKNRKAEKQKEELRRLALLPGNKMCMNCPVRGPLYAVIDFNIFVCTQCSAIHRSLQHKVKGISMSEFSDEEVAGLRVGGNERARLIWKAGFTQPVPAEGDERGIRHQIVTCFMDRRYFNVNEYDNMQNDQVQASLPPVTGLPSGISLPTPPHAVPAATAPHQVTTPAPAQTQTQKAPPPAAFPVGKYVPSPMPSGVIQGHVVPSVKPQQGGFDDFFSGPSAHQPMPSSVPPVPASKPSAPMDDFFGGPQQQPAQTQTQNSLDFFGNFSSKNASTGPAPAQVPAQQAHRGTPASDDFFSDFHNSAVSNQTRTTTSTIPAPTAVTNLQNQEAFFASKSTATASKTPVSENDFFGDFGCGATSSNANKPVPTHSQAQTNADFFGNPTPNTNGPISLSRKEGVSAGKKDAFADLYSF